MPEEPLEPLSAFAAELVSAERRRPGPTPEVEGRLVRRLDSAAPHLASPAAKLASRGVLKAVAWLTVGAVAGGGGAAWHYRARLERMEAEHQAVAAPREVVTPPPTSRAEPQRATAPTAPVVVVQPPLPAPAAPPRPAPHPPAPYAVPPLQEPPEAPPASSPRPSPDALAAESVLLERARTALLRGEADAALQALDAHQAAHPEGQLREEREVLAIQALSALRRGPQATERAAHFKARYPTSMLMPVVNRALQASP